MKCRPDRLITLSTDSTVMLLLSYRYNHNTHPIAGEGLKLGAKNKGGPFRFKFTFEMK